MKFTFITVSAPSVKCLIKAAEEISHTEPDILDLRLYYAVKEYGSEKTRRLISDIKTSDMVFVDLMGSPVELFGSRNESFGRQKARYGGNEENAVHGGSNGQNHARKNA